MCTPGSQGQALFLSSLLPHCWLELWSPSSPGLLEPQCIKGVLGLWVLAVAQNHRLVPGSQPPSFGYLWQAQPGKTGCQSPKGEGESEGHTGCGFLEWRHQSGMLRRRDGLPVIALSIKRPPELWVPTHM